jgi:predicted permease
MLTDLRLAVRQLRQSRGFAAIAVLSLALGIGANTAVFSLVNEFLLRSLPVRDPEQLVIFRNVAGARGNFARSTQGYGSRDEATGRFSTSSFPLHLLEQLRTRPEVLSDAFAFAPLWQANVLIDGQPELGITAQLASGSYHSTLGVSALIGRTLSDADDQPNAEPVAVISHRLWQRRFAGSPDVLGRTLQLNKVTVTIVGVTPAEFAGTGQVGEHYDLTVPIAQHGRFVPDMRDERQRASTWWVMLMGRLAPGVTPEQARAALEPLFVATARAGWLEAPRRADETVGETPDAPTLRADPGFQGARENRQRYTQSLRLMLGLVALVLLAACANVANLLLARATARRREIAVRLALGASRARIIRQLLAESLLLAFASAGLGVLGAWAARGGLLVLRPFGSDAANLTLPFDLRVLGFTIVAALITALAFGLAPALRATRVDLAQEFQGGRTAHGSRSWLSRSLVVIQIALSLLLLVCTGLLIGSLRNLQRVDAGFNRHQLAAFNLELDSAGYAPTQVEALRQNVQQKLALLPGVRGVSYSYIAPLSQMQMTSSVQIPGVVPPAGTSALDASFNSVSPNFFVVTQQPLLLGRAFTDADGAKAPKIAIVNETFVQRYLGGANPLGRRFHYESEKDEFEIVGVARDAKYADLRSEVPPTIYLAAAQREFGYVSFLVRTAGEPASILAAIRSTLRAIDPTLPVLNLRTMDDQIDRLHGQELLFARLAGFFGVLALTLACVGLYGLMSYVVARRTGEIGVRMALGALPGHVLRLFLGESLALVAGGIALGAFAAWGAAHLLTSMLFGLTRADPFTYGVAAGVLLAVALIAAAIPSWRAARVDPTVALRTE